MPCQLLRPRRFILNAHDVRQGQRLKLNGEPLRDWWEVVADVDAVVASGMGLLQ
jgi:hypothetical protein